MSSFGIGLIAFACLFGGALLGMRLRNALPGHHMNDDSRHLLEIVSASSEQWRAWFWAYWLPRQQVRTMLSAANSSMFLRRSFCSTAYSRIMGRRRLPHDARFAIRSNER